MYYPSCGCTQWLGLKPVFVVWLGAVCWLHWACTLCTIWVQAYTLMSGLWWQLTQYSYSMSITHIYSFFSLEKGDSVSSDSVVADGPNCISYKGHVKSINAVSQALSTVLFEKYGPILLTFHDLFTYFICWWNSWTIWCLCSDNFEHCYNSFNYCQLVEKSWGNLVRAPAPCCTYRWHMFTNFSTSRVG